MKARLPDRFAPRLHDIPLAELAAMGIRGLIVDLDNTLLGFRETELAAEHLAWVEEAHERGFAMVMVSNNFSERVRGIEDRSSRAAKLVGTVCVGDRRSFPRCRVSPVRLEPRSLPSRVPGGR